MRRIIVLRDWAVDRCGVGRGAAHSRGHSLVETLIGILAAACAVAIAVPCAARLRGDSGLLQSINNLQQIASAMAMYAGDWNDRQVTWIDDEISEYGNNSIGAMTAWHEAHGGCGQPCWHPPMILGWGRGSSGNLFLASYEQHPAGGTHELIQPIAFTWSGPFDRMGSFRFSNARLLHGYLDGRFYSPIFYAPNDEVRSAEVERYIESPDEFIVTPQYTGFAWVPRFSSYSLSPAAMYHPDVMRPDADGGWQDPWLVDHGFASPSYSHAAFPALKTHLIEHHWCQGNNPQGCNPAFGYPCEPYYFNHAIQSEPACLMYDLSVRMISGAQAREADELAIKQTGEGLWLRSTPSGLDGYFISASVEPDLALSHHVLTTRGILGRDITEE